MSRGDVLKGMTQEIKLGHLVIETNRESLLNFFQLVGLQTEEAHIKVNGEKSISISALDPSHVSMLVAELRSDDLGYIKMTNTGYVQKFVVRPEEVIKALKQFKKNTNLTIIIDVNEHKLKISGDNWFYVTINLIDSDTNTHELPYLRINSDAKFNIDVDNFARAIDTISKVSESVTIKVGSGVEIENHGLPEGHYYARDPSSKIVMEGNDWTSSVRIESDVITNLVSEMPITSTYRVEYLQKVLKILKQMVYEHSLEVKFGEKVPIIISSQATYHNRVSVKFFLAPYLND